MTVICLTDCPLKLRGDLTKWLLEINTGVYVGNINARVREELWNRITENVRSGQVTMVFRAAGEQHMDFRVHNTNWKPVDFDGLKLIMRPNAEISVQSESSNLPNGFSKAAKMRIARQMRHKALQGTSSCDYVVLDIETTGLNYNTDEILEIAALKIRGGEVTSEFNRLIKPNRPIPSEIQKLTRISDELVNNYGIDLQLALTELTEFIGSDKLLCWNAPFDVAFIQVSCNRCGLPIIRNKAEDAMKLAKKYFKGLSSYRLADVARNLGIEYDEVHRALPDCYLTHKIFAKLNENASEC